MRAALAAVMTVATFGAAFAASKLTPKEIQGEFFDGKPFTAATTSGTKFKMTFAADGKVTREPQDKAGAKGEGTWKLSKDGFCTTWKGSPANCYTIVNVDKNKWSVVKGAATVAVWSKLAADANIIVAQQTSAQPAHTAPPKGLADQQQLCAVISDARAKVTSLQETKKREGNPLKADTIQKQINDVLNGAIQTLLSILGPIQFNAYVGKVQNMSDVSAFSGKEYAMSVNLDCRLVQVLLNFKFSNNGTALELQGATPLTSFQSILGELNRGDTIEISGTFVNPKLNYTLPDFLLRDPVSFGARAARIQKVKL